MLRLGCIVSHPPPTKYTSLFRIKEVWDLYSMTMRTKIVRATETVTTARGADSFSNRCRCLALQIEGAGTVNKDDALYRLLVNSLRRYNTSGDWKLSVRSLAARSAQLDFQPRVFASPVLGGREEGGSHRCHSDITRPSAFAIHALSR